MAELREGAGSHRRVTEDPLAGGDRPRVSVMIPVHNRADLVGDSIASALAQTMRDLEVVVVDNASSDQTWGVIQEWAERDPRVRVFRNSRNIGPVRNWQRCFVEARGIFGKLLFSDDLIDPTYLARTVTWLDEPATAFVFTAVVIGESPEVGESHYVWRDVSGVVPRSQYLAAAVPGRGLVPVSPGAGLFRLADLRSSLRFAIPAPTHIDSSTLGAGPDVLLYLLTAQRYRQVAFVRDPLAFFRAHSGSITLSNRRTVSEGYRSAYGWFSDEYLRFPVRERALARMWLTDLCTGRRWQAPGDALGRYSAKVNGPLVAFIGLWYLAKRLLGRAAKLIRR